MNNKLSHKIFILLLVAGTAGVIIASKRLTLSFLWMFVVLALLLLIPFFISGRIRTDGHGHIVGKEDKGFYVKDDDTGFLFAAVILAFGIFTTLVLNQYFNPKESVFKNNDHHALRIDGISIGNPDSFILAENSNNAFFDRMDYLGRLDYNHLDQENSSVVIESERFTNPVYALMDSYDPSFQCNRYEIVNDDYLPVFRDGDEVTLISRQGEVLTFSVETIAPENKFSSAHAQYIVHNDNDTSEYRTFLQSGYPLKSILSNTSIGNIDLSGVSIARTVNYPAIKPRSVYEAYRDVPFALILSGDSEISQVLINGTRFDRPARGLFSIPLDRVFYIGFGENKSHPSKFHLNGRNLNLEFDMPEYQFLSSISDTPESTVMFTSSLAGQDGNIINDISDNVLLFEMFSHPGNIYHFSPLYLSFRTGRSDKEMVFSMFPSNSTTRPEEWANLYTMDYNLRTNGSDDKYEYYFPSIRCNGANNSRWNITAENFKETTPTKSSTIILIIFIISVLSSIMILTGSKEGCLYTKIEYTAYLLIIAFLSVRLFLMWRISVFPPVHSITKLEFIKFRDISHSNLYTIIISLVFFYSAVFLAKFKYIGKKCGWWLLGAGSCAILLLRFATPLLKKIPAIAIFGLLLLVFFFYWFLYYCASPMMTGETVDNIYKDKMYGEWRDKHPQGLTNKWVIGVVIGFVIFFYAGLLFFYVPSSTTANILLPLLFYIIVEIGINWFNPVSKFLEDEISPKVSKDIIQDYLPLIKYSLICSLVNTAAVSFVMLKHDGGYGSMFLIFAVFYSAIQVSDFFRAYPFSEKRYKMIKFINYILWFIVVGSGIVFIICYKHLMIMILDKPKLFALIVSGIVFLVLGSLSVLWGDKRFKHLLFKGKTIKIKTACIIGSAVVALVAGIFLFAHPSDTLIDGSHTEFRIRILNEDAEEIMANDISDDNDERKFTQASLNDWIIHEYKDYGKQVKPFGSKDKSSYFTLQPQSKVGAMWFAQTTDISLVRYIIAEHSEWLAVFFIIVFLIAFLLSLFENTRSNWTKAIIVMIPLLLLVQSTMIWMANTQRFVFFGQDFPLISITSNFATLYFFVLMLFWVISALVGDQDIMTPVFLRNGKRYNDEKTQKSIRKREGISVWYILPLAVIALVYILTWGQKKTHEYDKHTYDYENLIARAAKDLQIINENFEEYQLQRRRDEHRPLIYRTNMKADIDDFFNQYPLDAAIPDSTSFTFRLLEKYIENGSSHNSIQDVIHIHKKKTSDANGNVTTTLVFDIRDSFYRLKLPEKKSRAWKGNVIEYSEAEEGQHSFEITNDRPQYATAWISGRYLGEGKDVFLIKAREGARLYIRGNNCPVTVSQNSVPAAIVHEEDNVYLESVRREPLDVNKKIYFARNILLNGQRSFIYPMQADFFWARQLANDFKNALDEPDAGDINITLSSKLMKSLSDVYERNRNYHWDKSIVVADGDGKVKALVDFKTDGKYRLNPNDSRRIAEVSDSLYLEGESKRPEAQKFFNNLALLKMRKGPGSSQKPVLWTVVTTGYKTNYWETLRYAALPAAFEPTIQIGNKRYYQLHQYSGIELPNAGRPFQSLSGDEGSGGDIDLGFYMYKSSNYYNSLMAYIGSFDKSDLDEQGNPIFSEIQAPRNKDEYDDNKPYVKMYGTNTLYHFNRQLSEIDLSDPSRGIINLGFGNNFGYTIHGSEDFSRTASADASLYPSLQIRNSNGRSYPIALAEPSYFMADTREVEGRSFKTENAVKFTAIGAKKIWDVTPLKMAEMYGKMVSLNKNYHLTIEPGINQVYEPFELDENWNGMREYLQMRRPFIFGMNQVYTNGSGTAHSVFTNLNSRNLFTGPTQRYYIYGKTGTIDDNSEEDHLLAVVITDRDLNECTSQADLQRLKFYVIYITDYSYNGGEWQDVDADLIDAVVNSEEFRTYME